MLLLLISYIWLLTYNLDRGNISLSKSIIMEGEE